MNTSIGRRFFAGFLILAWGLALEADASLPVVDCQPVQADKGGEFCIVCSVQNAGNPGEVRVSLHDNQIMLNIDSVHLMQNGFQVSHIDKQLDGRNQQPDDVAPFRFCGKLQNEDEDGAFIVNVRYVPDQNDPCARDDNGFCNVSRSAKVSPHEKKDKKDK